MSTTMKISRETLDRLKEHGKMGDSFEDVVNGLLDGVEPPEPEKIEVEENDGREEKNV